MRKIVRCTIVACLLLYELVGALGYSLYRSKTKGNVLDNWDDGSRNGWVLVANGAVTLVVMFAFPLLMYPSRVTLHNIISQGAPCFDSEFKNEVVRYVETIVLCS